MTKIVKTQSIQPGKGSIANTITTPPCAQASTNAKGTDGAISSASGAAYVLDDIA